MLASVLLSWWSEIIAGIVGGFFSLVFFPVTTYIALRIINRCKTKLRVAPHIRAGTYSTHNLIVENKSCSTLRNVIAYISVTYSEGDICKKTDIKTYTTDVFRGPMLLSWPKVVNSRNRSSIDLNQDESQMLNVIRFHRNKSPQEIEIASEEGFYDPKWENKSRLVLNWTNDRSPIEFSIKITADNASPKEGRFSFDGKEGFITDKRRGKQ